ncbi:MAG TPA: EamA family transporter [Treponema sp.]|nr:EamA family transporter [Treponema sp.]
MKSRLQQTPVVVTLALICCALWGSAFPVIKIGYTMFAVARADTSTQILFAGSRFFFAGLISIVIGSIVSRKILVPKSLPSLLRIVCLSLMQTIIQYVFFYISLAHMTGVKGAILESLNIFFSIITASLLFRMEKLSARKIAGCLTGFAGIILVNLAGLGTAQNFDMQFTLTGEGFMILSTVGAAFASVLLRLFSRYDNPILLSGWQFVIGGAVMAAAGYCTGGRLTFSSAQSGLLLLYLSLLSATAYSLWSILLKYNDVSRVTIFGFMNPVFGVVLSALLLGEGQTLADWKVPAALVLVCAGIIFVNGKRAHK